jgi:hypothetical protein
MFNLIWVWVKSLRMSVIELFLQFNPHNFSDLKTLAFIETLK